MSDDEDNLCPLCVEEMDLSDKFFKPCPCEYQICRFCWHHIKENLNQRCPACRRIYTDEAVQFRPVTAEEMSKLKADKKAKARQKKEREAVDRKHLSNVRVVQKNLVYVVGLNPKMAVEEILRSQEYFGQYGKIIKLVINRKQQPGQVQGPISHQPGNHLGVYVTYATKPEAAKAIAGIDSNVLDGRLLRATYGTTKYCQAYLRHQSCMNSGCMYLHEPGEEADSFSKEELAAGKHHQKEVSGYTSDSRRIQIVPKITTKSKTNALPVKGAFGKEATWETYEAADDTDEGSALPATASWANKSAASASGSSKIQQIPDTLASNTSDARDATSESGDREFRETTDLPHRPEDASESTVSIPKENEEEVSKEIGESVVASVDYETEQSGSIEKSSDERPRHPSASGLEITIPFAYATATTDPFAFSFNSPISVPNPASPLHLRARNEFGSPSVVGLPPGHEEQAQQVHYNGSFDPFSEVRTASPVLKNAPSLLPPRMDVGPRFGLGLINPPGVVIPGMHPEYRSSFDPFQEDVSPVSVLPPPGIGSPSASSPRLSRPPGLYDPPPPQSPRLVNSTYHSQNSQPEPTQTGQTPRKSSRFGFAQDRQKNNVSTPTTTPRPNDGTFPPSVSELTSKIEPMDSLHEGFRALFPTANISFGGASETTVDANAVWSASPKSPLPNPPFATLQNVASENPSASWSVPFGTPNRMHAAFAAAARSESWQGEGIRNDPLGIAGTSNMAPPVISSAQDFLGAFLKAAQKSSPTEEVASRVEKGARFQGALTEHEAIAAQRSVVEEVDTRRRKAPFQDPAIMLIGTKSAAPSVSATIPPPNGRHRLPIFEHVAQGEHGRTSQANGRFRKPEGGGTLVQVDTRKNETGKQQESLEGGFMKTDRLQQSGNHQHHHHQRIAEGGGGTESRKQQQQQQQQQQQKKNKRGPAPVSEKNGPVAPPLVPLTTNAVEVVKNKDLPSPSSSSSSSSSSSAANIRTGQISPTIVATATTIPRERNGRKTNHQRDKKGTDEVEESASETKKMGDASSSTGNVGGGNGGGKKNWRTKKEEMMMMKNGSSLSSSSSSTSSMAESVTSTTSAAGGGVGGVSSSSSPSARHTTTTTTTTPRRNGRAQQRKLESRDSKGSGGGKEVVEEDVEEEAEEGEEDEEGEEEEERKRRRKRYENGTSRRLDKEEGGSSTVRSPTNVVSRDVGKGRRTRGGGGEGGEGGGTKMDDVATLEREVMEARREAAMVENRLNELIKKNRTYHM